MMTLNLRCNPRPRPFEEPNQPSRSRQCLAPLRTYAQSSLTSSSLILSRQAGMAGDLPLSTALRKRSKSSLGNLRRSKVTPRGATISRPWQLTHLAPQVDVIGPRADREEDPDRRYREERRE